MASRSLSNRTVEVQQEGQISPAGDVYSPFDGAACDQLINGARGLHKAKANGPSLSSNAACRVATTNRELGIKSVKRDQPDSQPFPKPEPFHIRA
jgi:hypothetical protein